MMMHEEVAIVTEPHKILYGVIFPVLVYMVHRQNPVIFSLT